MPQILNAQYNVGSNEIPLTSAQQTKLSAYFNDYSVINLVTKDLNGYLKNQTSPADIVLIAGDSTWQIELEENEIRSSDMLIMRSTSSGDFIQQKGVCNTYKGTVNGDTNQIARLFINEKLVSGYFFSHGKQFEIDPAQKYLQEPIDPSLQETYIVFENINRTDTSDFICLTDIDTIIGSGPFNENLDWRTDCAALTDLSWNNNPRYLELAIETDWEFFETYAGSDT
ncbi:MAG: hypothetical protein DHS20C18_30030 [Saprospiraceae bacterium]|nr:MAG: hypothetical protein DHS20C18_30030 [Saprospiraceae bacterium]